MRGLNWKVLMRRSPLTDPRSLVSSLVFHGIVLAFASLVALSAVVPVVSELPGALNGEIEAVDNRASRDGGGSPGELGGQGLMEALPRADGRAPGDATRDPSADALLAEILPAPPTAEAQRALPGPQITGLGILPGPGLGGEGVREEVPAAGSAAALGPAPSSSGPVSTPARSPTSSTAREAWPSATRSKSPSASCSEASTSFPLTPASVSSSTISGRSTRLTLRGDRP